MIDAVYKKKVLSIDDNREVATLLGPKIEEAGYLFESAYSGPEGLATMKKYQPDVVLLDIMMPVMDGFEVLRKIKADDQLQNTPVIMLTAKRDKASVLRAIQCGAKDYLTKPVEFEKILERVVNIQLEIRLLNSLYILINL